MKHGWTVPDIEDQETSRPRVPARGLQRGEHIVVLALIAQNREHHEHGVILPGEIDASDVTVLERQCSVLAGEGLLLPRLKQHAFGTIDAGDVVATAG